MQNDKNISLNIKQEEKKRPLSQDSGLSSATMGRVLHRTVDLAGTEAPGADVHMLGSAVDHSLDPLHVGLPSTVGAAVGVRDLNAEAHALVAEFTFRHFAIPSLLAG